jgi:hypothetical protein
MGLDPAAVENDKEAKTRLENIRLGKDGVEDLAEKRVWEYIFRAAGKRDEGGSDAR